MKRGAVAVVLVVVLSAMPLLAQAKIGAASPFFGTWKLNVAKSKYSPGPTPKSQVAKLEPIAGGMKVSSDRVEADGKMTHFEWAATFDGKDGSVKGDSGRDAVSVTKIDDYTLEIKNKKAGKVTTTIKAVYSKDGKSRTETVTGVSADGKKVENVTVWDKQ